ncbi:MAG TPA: hypothetical protein H9694_06855 [Firmicutes bacterium]|nr:hypothetical protein [Bacillota bacterium]
MNLRNKDMLFQAVGGIDDAILQDTEDFLARRSKGSRPALFPWKGIAATAAAAACIALLSVSLLAEPAASPGEGGAPSLSTSPLPGGAPPLSITANINEIGEPAGVTAQISLSCEDFTPLSYDELLAYFGAALPVEEALPAFHRVPPDGGYGVYQTQGRGVYYDGNSVTFATEDGEQAFTVTLAKAFLHPYDAFTLSEDELHFTELGGRSLALFHYTDENGDSCYYVEFLQNSVGYYVGTKNVSEADFLRGLASLVEESTGPAGKTHTVSGRVAVIDPMAGHIAIDLDEGEGAASLGIDLEPGETANYAVGDRITVTYAGEPATIGRLWKQQILQIEAADAPAA